jgi:hypothetical protein
MHVTAVDVNAVGNDERVSQKHFDEGGKIVRLAQVVKIASVAS